MKWNVKSTIFAIFSLPIRQWRIVLFWPFIIRILFTDRILWNLRKIDVSYDEFRSKQNWNPKAVNFFELTNYKQTFLKVRLNYSKFLGQHHILWYLFTNTLFKFGSICSLFMINDSLNHELFVSFHWILKKNLVK